MDDLRKAGIEDIGLITDPKVENPSTAAGDGRKVVMTHAHKHFGAEKVVKGETPHASSDMNVTPLIDVLLVLLIIFMAALPLTPEGHRHQPAARDQRAVEPTHVRLRSCSSTTPTGRSPSTSRPCTIRTLRNFLRDVFESRREKMMFIVGDPAPALRRDRRGHRRRRGAGVEKVGIVTEGMRRGESAVRRVAPSESAVRFMRTGPFLCSWEAGHSRKNGRTLKARPAVVKR